MFKGSMVAIATPMDNECNVDYPALMKLLDFHLAAGTEAIVIVGTTGEAGMLTLEERHHLVEYTVKHVNGRIPVIAGTGETATAQAIKLTQMALEAGADACLLMAPAYVKPTQEGLFRHYQAIAEAVPIPQILYNVPSRTACDILPETVARLALLPNIVGIKEATGQIARVTEILALCGDKIDVFSGDDLSACALILKGAKGVISVVVNVAPQAMREMVTAALKGDETLAKAKDAGLAGLHKALFVEANPIPVKWALSEMGLIEKGIRLPLTPLSECHHALVRSAMEAAGIMRAK
jgi:4-hydroxy-tetrahydrodipicolinate synthase